MLKVTQEDIDNGQANDCCDCMVALAAKRYFKTPFCDVLYKNGYIEDPIVIRVYDHDGFSRDFSIPPYVQQIILDFDNGIKPEREFEFETHEICT